MDDRVNPMQATVRALIQPGRGILAADESGPTIAARFPEEATANLDAMNRAGPQPWVLSFSYGRALQEPAQKAWRGEAANARAAELALFKRARLNGAAREGEYKAEMEAA